DLLVFSDRHPRECGRRFALRAGGEDDGLMRREVAIGAALFARKAEVAQTLGGLRVVDERAADEHDFAIVPAREIDHLLHAMDVRRERRHDDAAPRLAEHTLERGADGLLRRTVSGDERVRRIAHQREHAALSIAGEARQVGRFRIDRCVIDLEVAGVNDRAGIGRDRKAERIDDGVRDANRLDAKCSRFDHVAWLNRTQFRLDAEFIELVFDEPEGERHSVHRHVETLDEERHGADVIFMAVREKHRTNRVGALEEIRHVGNDDVDAERGGVGEHHSAVDDDGIAAVLVDHEVHPDLAETAERDDAEGCATHRSSNPWWRDRRPRLSAPLTGEAPVAPRGSRVNPVQHARIRNRLAKVRHSTDPRHTPFNAHTEPGVRERAVLARVEIPLELVDRQPVLVDPFEQQIVIVNALRAADDLAVTFGCDHVHAERERFVFRRGLHVERLDRSRIARDDHRRVERGGDDRLFVAADVVAEVRRHALRLQQLDRIAIGNAREGTLHIFEPRQIALENLQLLGAAVHRAPDDVFDEFLRELLQPVELEERHLRLHHPELHEMAARLRLLGAERRAEAVDTAEGSSSRLEIKLAGLRQERLLAEVVRLEQRRRSLSRVGGEDRRIDQDEIAIVEKVANRFLDLIANAQDRMLILRAQPEMAHVHEERGAVLFRCDRIILRGAEDLERFDAELDATLRALFRANLARHANRRLLRDGIGSVPRLRAHFLLEDDALQVTAAITNDGELQLARRALVVQPAADRDFLANVLREILDSDVRHKGGGLYRVARIRGREGSR